MWILIVWVLVGPFCSIKDDKSVITAPDRENLFTQKQCFKVWGIYNLYNLLFLSSFLLDSKLIKEKFNFCLQNFKRIKWQVLGMYVGIVRVLINDSFSLKAMLRLYFYENQYVKHRQKVWSTLRLSFCKIGDKVAIAD